MPLSQKYHPLQYLFQDCRDPNLLFILQDHGAQGRFLRPYSHLHPTQLSGERLKPHTACSCAKPPVFSYCLVMLCGAVLTGSVWTPVDHSLDKGCAGHWKLLSTGLSRTVCAYLLLFSILPHSGDAPTDSLVCLCHTGQV